MDPDEFRKYGHRLVDWMSEYLRDIEKYPVKAQVSPEEIYKKLPERLPLQAESMDDIIRDFEHIILPGMSHWQHPQFHAYFPGNSSPPSVLAEMLMATIGAQCMKWDTSPAATELEQKVMEWLRDAMGIPITWSGVIHDTASTATLTALISAREKITKYNVNQSGFIGQQVLRVYCSDQTHSSIEKGAKIAGFGVENVIKIKTDESFAMMAEELQLQIESDKKNGYIPCCVVVTHGTTGTTAIDPLSSIVEICSRHDIWVHVDAAYGGTALLLPEYQWMIEGIDHADSFVFNPHKWLFTNFDCTAYFVKDEEHLTKTFTVIPEYLKTKSDHLVNNYSDWGIPLGRRFRALKLWFVLRYYGLEGIQTRLRLHIDLAVWLENQIRSSPDFELLAPRSMNLVCFHYRPKAISNPDTINAINQKAMYTINDQGQIYFTHTTVHHWFALRVVTGQTNVEMRHVEKTWKIISQTCRMMGSK